jgi:hypothetical protein
VLILVGVVFVTVGNQSDSPISPALFWGGILCFVVAIGVVIRIIRR